MKLGDVLRKEREKKEVSIDDMAKECEMTPADYQKMENGESPAEQWGPILAKIAIKLETPTSRLLADSGKAADVVKGKCGGLIIKHRERRELAKDQVAEYAELSAEEYDEVEAGKSPIEVYGKILLRFAEVIEQPVFNLFYPCGLPFQELDDYP